MYPLPIPYSTKYAAMLLMTVPVKLGLLFFYKWAGRRQPSAVFGSLGLDSILDFLITLCAFCALSLSNKIGLSFDGFAGMAISAILIVQSIGFIKDSLGSLLGKRDEKLCKRIEESVRSVDGVKDVKDVQCHTYGKNTVANIIVETFDTTVSKELIERIKEKTESENLYGVFVDIGG
jgi:divalent metal cation (Fe/Co/Zn/Cd) transporter